MEKKRERVCWQDGDDLERVLLERRGDDVRVVERFRMVGSDEWITCGHAHVPIEAWLDMAWQLATEQPDDDYPRPDSDGGL